MIQEMKFHFNEDDFDDAISKVVKELDRKKSIQENIELSFEAIKELDPKITREEFDSEFKEAIKKKLEEKQVEKLVSIGKFITTAVVIYILILTYDQVQFWNFTTYKIKDSILNNLKIQAGGVAEWLKDVNAQDLKVETVDFKNDSVMYKLWIREKPIGFSVSIKFDQKEEIKQFKVLQILCNPDIEFIKESVLKAIKSIPLRLTGTDYIDTTLQIDKVKQFPTKLKTEGLIFKNSYLSFIFNVEGSITESDLAFDDRVEFVLELQFRMNSDCKFELQSFKEVKYESKETY